MAVAASTAPQSATELDAPPRRSWAFVTLVTGIGFLAGVAPIGDNSFLVHLTTGRLILEHGFPRTDPYSFSAAGAKWVPQSWLAEVAYGVLYDAGGFAALRVFTGVVAALLALTIFVTARRLTRDPLRALVVSIGALACSVPLWNERPLLIGALCFALLVLVLEAPGRFAERAQLVIVPALMWVWGNSHGSWVLGVAYVAARVVGNRLDRRRDEFERDRRVLIATVVGVALIALNPYGIDQVLFPLELGGRSEILERVREWTSPNLREPRRWPLLVWAAVTFAAVGSARGRRWRDGLVAAGFLGLAFWATRNILLAPIATLPIVARAWVLPDGARSRIDVPVSFDRVVAGVLAAVFALLALTRLAAPSFDADRYPVQAMRALDGQGLVGRRLVTTDVAAGYVIERYWPRQRVFFDDRYDMYPLAVSRDYLALYDGAPNWREVLDRVGAEVVIWPARAPLSQLLAQDPQWRADATASTDDLSVFVRR